MSSAARSDFLHVHVCSVTVVVQWQWDFFVRGVATKLHACVKSTTSASYTFCRMVAERLRQQWHDLASSQGLVTRLVSH